MQNLTRHSFRHGFEEVLWRIALPNDDTLKELLRAGLEVLAQRFDDDRVTVDTSTFNASRIARIPGTVNRKGDDTAQRPHRKAGLLDIPEVEPVSREQLEQVAGDRAAKSDSNASRASASSELQTAFAALCQRGITVNRGSATKTA